MEEALNVYKNTSYKCYQVQIRATEDVTFDAWVGAVVRNNLLYFSEQIRIQKTNRSLREQIDTFPLNNEHPLYKELQEGFPKGYVLTNFSHANMTKPTFSIRKGELFSFSLLLIGRFNEYRYYFFEAIREMCEHGIGKPVTPFRLLAITESPSSPVSLSDFIQPEIKERQSEITIRFQTPIILYRLKEKKNKQLSYQDKCNRFPSLYQLTRSAFTRLQKLHALYAEPDSSYEKPDTFNKVPDTRHEEPTANVAPFFEETPLEIFLEKAGRPILKSASIQYINLPNTQKKEKKNDIPLAGFIGDQKYIGQFQQYLPLLKFMEKLGLGNETVYGMGRYEIEECSTNRIDENQKIEIENEIKTLDNLIHPEETDICEQNQPNLIKLPQLIIRFKNQITQREIPVFINAIVKKAIENNVQFHQYMVSGYHYRYPCIQFKRISEQAVIICIGEGTESIGGFFSSLGGQIHFAEKEVAIEIENVKAEKILVQAWDNNFTYTIRKYLPFSNRYFIEFQKICETFLHYDLIERILKANISLFFKSIGIHSDRDVTCKLVELEEKTKVKYKNHTFVSFDLKFKTNVSLPEYIGLGIGVSHGFGTVVRVRN